MSNPSMDLPHLYKKGKILKFKNLDPSQSKVFYFTSDPTKPNVAALIKHSNNINQLVAHCWFRLAKIGSYFGIQKDPSSNLVKNKIPMKKFWDDLLIFGEGDSSKSIQEIIAKLDAVEKKFKPNLVTEDSVKEIIKNFDEKLEEIRQSIKNLVG